MRTICIDIDGTISHYIDWVDSKTFGDVLPHCAETIHHLKADGWFVIIFTTRGDNNEVSKFLTANNIPFDAINENPSQPDNAKGGKPYADVYIDDRAIQFDGDWAAAYEKITGFKTWEQGPITSTDPPLEYCEQLLLSDFSQCMKMHRHYDTMNWQITKFAFGEILVAIGACWTVYSLETAQSSSLDLKWFVMFLICMASWLFGILSVYTIVKNRRYFVRTSRHINELRHHVLNRKPYGFKNKAVFWADYNYPKVRDWSSTQFISLYMVTFLTMIMGSATIYTILKYYHIESVFWPFIATLFTLAVCCVFVIIVAKENFNNKEKSAKKEQ